MHNKPQIGLIGAVFGVIVMLGLTMLVAGVGPSNKLASRLKNNLPSLSINAENNVQIDRNKVGVFGVQNDSQAEDLGVTWTRLPLQWANLETRKGEYTATLDALQKTKVLATIRAVNSGKTSCVNEIVTASRDISCMPTDLDAYVDFIGGIVSEYKDKVDAWQIENEVYTAEGKFWNGDEAGKVDNFMTMFKAVANKIKEVDPGKPILAPSIRLSQLDFTATGEPITSDLTRSQLNSFNNGIANINRVYTEGCNYFTTADIHLYHTVESIPNRLTWLKSKVMNQNNCVKPIWATEVSGPDLRVSATNLTESEKATARVQQVSELPLRLKSVLDNGVDLAIYFLYQDASSSNPTHDQKIKNLGLLDELGNRKPAYDKLKSILVDTGTNPPLTPNAFVITPTEWNPKVGESKILKATVTDGEAKDITSQYTVSWSVVGPQTISLSSVIGSAVSATALAEGTTVIKATAISADKTVTAEIQVPAVKPVDPKIVSTGINLAKGWNMVTLPFLVTSSSGNIFYESNVFSYDATKNEYENLTSTGRVPKPAEGFWVYTPTAVPWTLKNVDSHSPSTDPTSINLKKGWNIVGNPFDENIEIGSWTQNIELVSGDILSTLGQAVSNNLIGNRAYSYINNENKYQNISLTNSSCPTGLECPAVDVMPPLQTLTPATGFWIYATQANLTLQFSR